MLASKMKSPMLMGDFVLEQVLKRGVEKEEKKKVQWTFFPTRLADSDARLQMCDISYRS